MKTFNKIELLETVKGLSTIVKSNFLKGEIILCVEGVEVSERNRYSIQIGINRHIIPNSLSGKYINHSCNPNIQFNNNMEFVALKNIARGEEITFDYDTTEDDISEKFICCCGSENCKVKIVGSNNLF